MSNDEFVIRCSAGVGDGAVGKTTLCMRFQNKRFPSDYIPTIMDNFTTESTKKGKKINLEIYDYSGRYDYEKLRILGFLNKDIFIVQFSIISPTSLDNVLSKWYPELRQYAPHAPFVLCGNKKDLRDNPECIEKMKQMCMAPVSYEQGRHVAQQIGAIGYFETSALTGEGVEELFDAVTQFVLDPPSSKKKKLSFLKSFWKNTFGGLFKKLTV